MYLGEGPYLLLYVLESLVQNTKMVILSAKLIRAQNERITIAHMRPSHTASGSVGIIGSVDKKRPTIQPPLRPVSCKRRTATAREGMSVAKE